MKLFDKVKLLRDTDYYNRNGVYKGRIGRINESPIFDNCFEVVFIDERFFDKDFHWTDENMKTVKDDFFLDINVKDLEVVEESDLTDEELSKNIPPNANIDVWCKVENGYIMNLLGEKKNKIPYDYNS